MNKKLKTVFYVLITIHLSIILMELCKCIIALFEMKFGHSYLDKFVIENNYEDKIRQIIKRKIFYTSYRVLMMLGYAFLVYFLSSLNEVKTVEVEEVILMTPEIIIERPNDEVVGNNKRSNELSDNELIDDEVVGNDNIPNDISLNNKRLRNELTNDENFAIHFGDQTEIIGVREQLPTTKPECIEDSRPIIKLLRFLESEENILMFVTYVFFVLTYAPYFFKYLPLLLLLLILPYGYLKMNMKLYMKYRYAKCFFFSVYMSLILGIYSIFSEGKVKSTFDNGKSLPEEIYDYFVSRGYEITVERSQSKHINVGIVGFMNVVYIKIMGNFDMLKLKEQIAVFYHEIGHVENNSLFFRMLISKFFTVMMMILEVMFLKMNRKIISQKISKHGSWFLTFILIQMTILPFNSAMCNYYNQLDEYEADSFSMKNINPKFLASALCEIILRSKTSMEFSKLYSYFHSTHPSIQNRLNRLGIN